VRLGRVRLRGVGLGLLLLVVVLLLAAHVLGASERGHGERERDDGAREPELLRQHVDLLYRPEILPSTARSSPAFAGLARERPRISRPSEARASRGPRA